MIFPDREHREIDQHLQHHRFNGSAVSTVHAARFRSQRSRWMMASLKHFWRRSTGSLTTKTSRVTTEDRLTPARETSKPSRRQIQTSSLRRQMSLPRGALDLKQLSSTDQGSRRSSGSASYHASRTTSARIPQLCLDEHLSQKFPKPVVCWKEGIDDYRMRRARSVDAPAALQRLTKMVLLKKPRPEHRVSSLDVDLQ